MEIYEQMGIVNKAITQGQNSAGINVVVKGKKIQHVPFGLVGNGFSGYPFLLILEQNKSTFEKFSVKVFLFCFVRPDNYAGYVSDELNFADLKKYLEENCCLN